MKTKITLVTVGAAMLLATAASAQSARENYSYTAPSGQFGDGTTAWQNYRFRAMDAERMQELRNGVTGSIPRTDQGSAISTDTVGQPGRRTTRRTN